MCIFKTTQNSPGQDPLGKVCINTAGLVPSSRHIEGVVEMMLDATQRYALPLNEKRLFGWHAALFPTGYSGFIPDNTSGIYTRGKRVAFYTTVTPVLYRTSDLRELEYYYLGGKFMRQIENFKIPEDKKTFTTQGNHINSQ